MKSISLFIVVIASLAFCPCPAACFAFSNFQLKFIQKQHQNAPTSPQSISSRQWTNNGQRIFKPRTRLSHLHFSKITENVVEEEPIIKSPPSSNGSTNISSNGSNEKNNKINSINGNNPNNSNINQLFNNMNDERSIGILVLMTVPLAWGTYGPVVKYMYEKMDPSMPGFVFSAGYYLVAATTLGVISSWQDGSRPMEDDAMEGDERGEVDVDSLSVSSDDDIKMQSNGDENEASITTRGGWELGSYLFIGNGLQIVGLQTVPADRAAFLVQLTTVMVPLLSALSEGTLSAVPLQTWIACIIAFIGVIVMGADDGGSSSSSIVSDGSEAMEGALSTGVDRGFPFFDAVDMHQLASSLQLSQGDVLIALAALAYTMHVVRLGAYAPRTTPLKLAASKASTEAFLSVLLVIGLTFIGSTHFPSPEFVSQTGSDVLEYFTTIISAFKEGGMVFHQKDNSIGVSIGAILWTGWVTCAYTIYAQSFGQRRVNPTDSNLIYTTQPLFSSAFAYVLLGETLGFYGYVGAAMIGTALLVVSSSENDS